MITDKFYINGEWVEPHGKGKHKVINPATDQTVTEIPLGNADDVNAAIAAAKAAFPAFSQTSVAERKALLTAILTKLMERNDEIADVITQEMGAPVGLSRAAQAPSGPQHFGQIINVLDDFEFTDRIGKTDLRKEPIGVCALITPWNWPMNQIATKVAPAIAAGCTMVLKPSENAPLDAILLTEIMDEVGVPPGVFNLVHGDGPGVGSVLTQHKDVEMVSFTGSTRAGIAISQNAAPTIKRVALELGGKSPSIVLPDADIEAAVSGTVRSCMGNSGQSCNAPTLMFVPRTAYDRAADVAAATANALTVGDPTDAGTNLGPIANRNQYAKVKELIQSGIDEGATVLAGGLNGDIPSEGFFVRPTVFGDVTPEMRVFKEEIFGPVICLLPYDDVEDAVEMGNLTEYGLSGYVWGKDDDACYETASKIRSGMVHINGASLDAAAPFGGYKMSGNGREWGEFGLEEFLETKSIYRKGS